MATLVGRIPFTARCNEKSWIERHAPTGETPAGVDMTRRHAIEKPSGDGRGVLSENDRKILRRSRRIYLALVVWASSGMISQMLGQPIFKWGETALGGYGLGLIYLGLSRRKAWVIPLIRMSAAVTCVQCFAAVLYPATNGKELGATVVFALLFLFSAHQLLFFGKARVRAYLDDTGSVLF